MRRLRLGQILQSGYEGSTNNTRSGWKSTPPGLFQSQIRFKPIHPYSAVMCPCKSLRLVSRSHHRFSHVRRQGSDNQCTRRCCAPCKGLQRCLVSASQGLISALVRRHGFGSLRLVLATLYSQRSRVVYPAYTMALRTKGSVDNTTAFGSRYLYASSQW